MENSSPKIAIISGEISGDQYASLLIYYLKKIIPSSEIIGIGGPKLKMAGAKIIAENQLAGTFGICSVIKNLSGHLKFLNQCVSAIKKENPDLIIFIDNPGFNLSLAKRLPLYRKIYYIPPKIWAHHYQRIFLIKHLFESVIVIFPFEKTLFEKEGIPAYYFGHPVLDIMKQATYDEKFLEKTSINQRSTIIGIFPGSRKKEIEYILPILIRCGKIIQKKYNVSFVISCADEKLYEIEKKILEKENLDWSIWKGSSHTLAKFSHIALTASGTMNLEIALVGTPMIVFYRMPVPDYIFARAFVQTDFISPVNIIYGKKLIEEFVQNVNWLRFQRVFSEIFDSLSEKRKNQIEGFKILRQQLGEEKINEKIATFISQRL